MSQVAIVIDLPFVDAEQLQGQNVLRIAEDTAREFRKSQPVDDAVRVAGVYVSSTPVVVEHTAYVEPETGEEVLEEIENAEAPAVKPKRKRAPKPKVEKPKVEKTDG